MTTNTKAITECSSCCWIIYSKNQGLTITKNSTSTTLHNDQPFGSSQGSSNARFNVETTSINGFQTNKNELDIAMLQILDPHLRPVPPVPNEPTSQKIYKEHMDLAQEYFKNQTEIAYLTKHKESLLQSMSPEERNIRLDICNKLKEKEALLKLESHLRHQLEIANNHHNDEVSHENGCIL